MLKRLIVDSVRPVRRAVAALALLAGAIATLPAGCGGPGIELEAPPPAARPTRFIPSYDETIGAYGDIPANDRVLVRGYGLVLLPAATGSRECPTAIRKIIMDQLTRMRVGETMSPLAGTPMQEWIDSPYTAAVEVRGLLPVGALDGQMFDVLVSALPGTQTTSLEGGVLISTDLSIWRRGMGAGLIHGATMAVASGTIFINPFANLTGEAAGESPAVPAAPAAPTDDAAGPAAPDTADPTVKPDGPAVPDDKTVPLTPPADKPAAAPAVVQPVNADEIGRGVGTPVDPRRGMVLNGGMSIKEQPLFLILRESNYQVAAAAQEQLNARFPTTYLHGSAHAVSPTTIELKVPAEYRDQVGHWLSLVDQVFLRREPGFLEERMHQLVKELSWPDSNKLRVARTFMVIGKPAQEVLRPLYADASPSVSFYAAYAGLHIGDNLALGVIRDIVHKPDHPFRLDAIRALGENHRFRNLGLTSTLTSLLAEENPQVRTAAYHSLEQLGSPLVQSRWIGELKLGFRLDVVRSGGPFLVYVTRAAEPRVVLFGGDSLSLMKPTFLHAPRAGVTISASADKDDLTVLRVDPRSDKPLTLTPKTLGVDPATGKPLSVTSYRVMDLVQTLGGPPRFDEEGQLMGLGLNYCQVVNVLYQLSRQSAIPASVYLQPMVAASVELASEAPAETPTSIESEAAPATPAATPAAGETPQTPGATSQPEQPAGPAATPPPAKPGFTIEGPAGPPKIGG